MTLYTGIFSDYDYLKPVKVPQKAENLRLICYTDQPESSEVFDLVRENNPWKIVRVPVMECGAAKTARWYKINAHEHIDDDISVWIDGTFFVNTDVGKWVMPKLQQDFITVAHPFDNCLYVDAFACMSGGKGDKWRIIDQINTYKNLGIPENNGLISSGILMRRNTKEVAEACAMWWDQVEQFSERDQIAFGYVNWKLPGCHKSIRWNYSTQTEFQHCPHRHKKWGVSRAYQLAGL